jgi:hypothetical protein
VQEMKEIFVFLVAILSGVLSVMMNDALLKALSTVPTGIWIYKVIVGAFVGLLIAFIFTFIDKSTHHHRSE